MEQFTLTWKPNPIPRFIALDPPSLVDVTLSEPLLATKAGFAVSQRRS